MEPLNSVFTLDVTTFGMNLGLFSEFEAILSYTGSNLFGKNGFIIKLCIILAK